jgi:hypothetical protein
MEATLVDISWLLERSELAFKIIKGSREREKILNSQLGWSIRINLIFSILKVSRTYFYVHK